MRNSAGMLPLAVLVVICGIGMLNEIGKGSYALPAPDPAVNKTCKDGSQCPIHLQCVNETCQVPCPGDDLIWSDDEPIGCRIVAGKYGCEKAADCIKFSNCVSGKPPQAPPRIRKKRHVVLVGPRYGYYRRPFYRPYYGYYGRPYGYYHYPSYYHYGQYGYGYGSAPNIGTPPPEETIGYCRCRSDPWYGNRNGTCPNSGKKFDASVIPLILCGIIQLINLF